MSLSYSRRRAPETRTIDALKKMGMKIVASDADNGVIEGTLSADKAWQCGSGNASNMCGSDSPTSPNIDSKPNAHPNN